MATAKVEVDDTFEKQIRALQQANMDQADAVLGGTSPSNTTPALLHDWDGNLFDLEGLSTPFNRDTLNQAFISSISNVEDSGVSGDMVSATTQIDYLGTMERAFRARHTMRRPRATAHAAGRMRAHGDAQGTLVQNGLEYIRARVRQANA